MVLVEPNRVAVTTLRDERGPGAAAVVRTFAAPIREERKSPLAVAGVSSGRRFGKKIKDGHSACFIERADVASPLGAIHVPPPCRTPSRAAQQGEVQAFAASHRLEAPVHQTKCLPGKAPHGRVPAAEDAGLPEPCRLTLSADSAARPGGLRGAPRGARSVRRHLGELQVMGRRCGYQAPPQCVQQDSPATHGSSADKRRMRHAPTRRSATRL